MNDAATPVPVVLAFFIVSFVLGGTIIGALSIRRWPWQLALTLFLSLLGASLSAGIKDVPVYIPMRFGNMAGLLLLALFTLAFARLILAWTWARKWTDALRRALTPHLWLQSERSPASFGDLRKRWFVTASAATGSVVGVVLLDSTHWKFIGAAFDPSQIFFTFLLAAISFTLIGPGEEFVVSAGVSGPESEEPRSLLEQAISGSSLRAIGRFVLVGLAWVLLDMVHKYVDATLSQGEAATAIELLFGSVPPAIITYYWCAALQRDVPSVAKAAGTASWRATGLLFAMGPFAWIAINFKQGFLSNGAPHFSLPQALGLIATLPLFSVVALIWFTVWGGLYGIAALFCGWVLDKDRRNPARSSFHTVAVLAVILGVWNALLGSVVYLSAVRLANKDPAPQLFLLAGLASLGWAFGLLVSGFPKIVERARSRSSVSTHFPENSN